MEIQDKIGRDQAKIFLKEFETVHENIKERVNIFKNAKMYKFLSNTESYVPYQGRFLKSKRTWETGKIILPYEIERLVVSEIITKEEADNLTSMIFASEEDFMVAEMSINTLRNKRLKKKKNV